VLELPDETGLVEAYRHSLLLKVVFIISCFAALMLVIGYSLAVGQGITVSESYEIMMKHLAGETYPLRSEMWWKDYFIWNNVMPRVAVGIIGGCGLAACGAVMQSIMSNPLADPYTTGISSGACFGAVASLIAGVSFASLGSGYTTVTNAFMGALVPTMIVILISRRINATPATLILIGVAISYFFNAAVTLMMVTATADDLQAAYLWQVGTLTGMTWSSVPLMLVITAAGSAVAMLFSKNMNLLTMGENSAKSMGLDVEQFRMLCLIMVAVMTAAIVSFTGILGFVGLISPHITRLVIGSDNRVVIPASMIVGALMLVSCDLISRLVSNITDIPVGVVLSLLCSPIFLLMVTGLKRGRGVY
jgi:iron complex transport system permease protein